MIPSPARPTPAQSQHIVLIHGMWCSSRSLTRIARLFRDQGYQVHIPDLPLRSPSSHLEAPGSGELGALSLQNHADHVSGYIESLELEERPILVGHSLGALVAQLVAVRDQASALILFTPAPPSGINTLLPVPAWNCLSILTTWRFWRKPMCMSWRGARAALFNRIEPARQRDLYEEMIWDSGRTFGEIVFWFLDPNHTTKIRSESIRVPILVVGAGRDGILPSSVSRKVAAKYPQAEYVHYQDHGHWLIDEPGTDAIVEDTARWLEAKVPAKHPMVRDMPPESALAGADARLATTTQGATASATKEKYERALS